MNPSSSFPRNVRARVSGGTRGFTLVEITLALGITCVALIPLIALLPIGMTTLRQAADQTAITQITQKIVSEAQQSDFDAVSNPIPIRYFDDQTRELPASRKAESLYQASATVVADSQNPHLKRLLIQVARNPGEAVTLKTMELPGAITVWSGKNILPVATRNFVLARTSRIAPVP